MLEELIELYKKQLHKDSILNNWIQINLYVYISIFNYGKDTRTCMKI